MKFPPKTFFNNDNMQVIHSLSCYFIYINKSLTLITILIGSVFVLGIKYFKLYIAIQIEHLTEINGKGSPFIKQLSCKFFIVHFFLKGPKTMLYKELQFPF